MTKRTISPAIVSGLIVGLLALFLYTGIVSAAPNVQGEDPPEEILTDNDCVKCHRDVAGDWSPSPHAHAYDDPVFQEQWIGLGGPNTCLACHTTNYKSSTGEYETEGVSCQSCHGTVTTNHPDQVVPTIVDTYYCGSCHTTTLSEWRSTGHASGNVDCMDCHNPHSQKPLFDNPDDLCINCHRDGMGDYLNDLHVQQNIGCVDCHALVIQPDETPDDGIVPTGHGFTISPQTCVACHTDALHAGFTLPGYENGASGINTFHSDEESGVGAVEGAQPRTDATNENELTDPQRIQTLETALASSRISNLFQGAVIGLVLGGSTAWIVGQNIRPRSKEEEEENDL
jgi:predicted CXXCH cytochrome family protein